MFFFCLPLKLLCGGSGGGGKGRPSFDETCSHFRLPTYASPATLHEPELGLYKIFVYSCLCVQESIIP